MTKRHRKLYMGKKKPGTFFPASPKKNAWWNGRRCNARIVRVIVGHSDYPTWWCAQLEGQEREAVEIWAADQAGPQPFYIDNEDGIGWRKVTELKGHPMTFHRSLPVKQVIEPVTTERPIKGAFSSNAT